MLEEHVEIDKITNNKSYSQGHQKFLNCLIALFTMGTIKKC